MKQQRLVIPARAETQQDAIKKQYAYYLKIKKAFLPFEIIENNIKFKAENVYTTQAYCFKVLCFSPKLKISHLTRKNT
ncbi:hypothetical protein T05_5764 [Trichinella murrelli]|uniref:Uncharacterized protein n=1 Tax=Trichinella murrelli TaxID=144512 RepID=A0A0V0UFL8_9BILA|nr:hypothetical protein T05_5764 [Trichinella murrelli]